MSKPLISIIITVLNGAKTLDKCLLSIFNQSFADYELIIVDGGSEDSTLEIIESSTITNKIVHVIPGIGLYAGLNAGVKLSVGQWLYFIGADDELYSSHTLRKVSEIIRSKRKETKVLVGSVECIKQNMLLQPLFGSPLLMRHQVHHQGMFYSRDIFDKCYYNENMRIASDYEFNLEIAMVGIPHEVMNIIVCNFGGDGISENESGYGFEEMQRVHERLFKGPSRYWAMSYFWLRRNTGSILRKYNLHDLSMKLKKTFG